ncbi:MAG: ABC transporter permease [bacterium]|nr:MAG: ABC transporter permease [bacterium]
MNQRQDSSEPVYKQTRVQPAAVIFYILCGLIFLFLIAPLVIVIPISFSSAKYLQFPPTEFSLQWYKNFFGTDEWVRGALNSLKIATLTSLLASALGIPTALALTRYKFKGKQLIQSFLISPMITPVIIIAIAAYFFFANLHMIGSTWALVISHSILAIPIVLVTVSASLHGFDQTLELAAMSLGANRLKTFFKITFPLIRPGIVSGALFAFITSFDEVVLAIFVATYRSITLPKHMWAAMRQEIDPTIAAVSSLLVTGSIIIILIVGIVQRRGKHIEK